MRLKNMLIVPLLVGMLGFSGCAPGILSSNQASTAGQSAFTGEKVRPGMSRREFIAKNGEPYKTAFRTEPDGTLYEILYYKERLGLWYILNMAFHFRDGKLVTQEQLNEELLYQNEENKSK